MKNKLLASVIVAILLMSTCAIAFNFVPKATGDTMYYVEVKTQPEGIVAINGTGWYTDSSTVNLEAPQYVDSPRYRFVRWNIDGVNKTLDQWNINVVVDSKNHTCIAIYIRQWKLTVVTGYESLGVLPYIANYTGSWTWYQTSETWFDDGATAYAGIEGLDGSGGVYVTPIQWAYFVNFTVPGRNVSVNPPDFQSDPITMSSDLTVLANWRMQYYLYVMTVNYHPAIPGQGWYWEGTVVTLTAPEGPSSPPPPAGLGWWWKFDKWEVTGTGNVCYDKSVNVTMNTNKTATCYYKAMYYLWVYDWPLNTTTLYTYSGWKENCTYVTMTADDTIPAGAGTRYKFYGWWRQGVGYFSTDLKITVHINATNLPIRLEACYKLQYELTVQTNPLGVTPLAGAGWYDANTVVPLGCPQIVNEDTSTRYKFLKWVKDPGGVVDTNNATTITMYAPRTATAYYDLEYKLIWDDDKGSSYYGEWWYSNATWLWTGWYQANNLGAPYTPPMATMVFHHWELIKDGSSTHLGQGVNQWYLLTGPTTFLAHYVNQTFIILSPDIAKIAPGAYCTYFDVDVTFANFNSQRNDSLGQPMDLYGAEFMIVWDGRLIELKSYTPHLDNIWPTGSYIHKDEIGYGYFWFAAHAINATTGFEETRVMLTLHFHVIYEPCYNYQPATWIYMQWHKLANHLDQSIVVDPNYDWAYYIIKANQPQLALESSITEFEYINDQNRVFTVDVMGYDFVKIKDYNVTVTWNNKHLKCLDITWCDLYFKPPYLKKAFYIDNTLGFLRAELEIDYAQGSPKVNGTAKLFTITFEIVLDKNFDAWWAPNHQAYKINVLFDKDRTYLSGQCEPFGSDNEIFKYATGRLGLVDADPWYTPYTGDLNYDGHIDLDDLMLIKLHYGPGGKYDISWVGPSYGCVDIFDAVLVALNLWEGPLD